MKTVFRFVLIASGFLLSVLPTRAQLDIHVKIPHLSTDTIWFGYTTGKRAHPLLRAVKNAEGTARLHTDSVLPDGIYALMYKRGRSARYTYLSCLLTENERVWRIETLPDQPYRQARVSDAPLNDAYIRYYDAFQSRLRLRDSLNERWRLTQLPDDFDALTQFEADLRRHQLSVQTAHAGTLLDTIIRWTLLPDPADWLDRSLPIDQRRLRREAGFRQAALLAVRQPDAPRRLRCPLWIEWLDLTVFSLYLNADDMRQLADDLLQALRQHPDIYQYYFTYMVNSFSNISRFQADEVFLYLFNRYVQSGNTPWLDEEQRKRLAELAAFMPGTMVGDQARDAELRDRYGRPLRLHSLLTRPTLLIFWDPECHHCQNELPELQQVCAMFDAQGLQVVTICAAKGPRVPQCWAFVDSLNLPGHWLYLYEPENVAALYRLYNLRSFPRLFLIDRNKTIVYRRAGAVTPLELEYVLKRFFF